MDPVVQDVDPPVPKPPPLRPSPPTLVFSPSPDDDRPSDRPTRPTLPPPEDPSSDDVTELSTSDFLVSDVLPAVARTDPPPRPSTTERSRRLLPALRIGAAGLLLLSGIVLLLDAPSSRAVMVMREPRVAWPERTTAGQPATMAAPAPAPRSCIATGAPRLVASRALVAPGLDVSSSSTTTGFVVALASASDEASAIRLEGSTLRVAETVRVRTNAGPIRRVLAHDRESLAVHVDAGDAREAERVRSLWRLPPLEALRVAPRDGGGAVIVGKRESTLYVGFVAPSLAASGPVTSIPRPGATIGTPFVVAHGAGAAVVWAERAPGAREWTVMIASLGGGELETAEIGRGMSPSLAALPDGGFLVAYADGPAAAHRVVVRRLGSDLEPMREGDLVVASPEGVNAGQPVVAARPDGGALVAWLAVDRGRGASAHATPIQCDVATSM